MSIKGKGRVKGKFKDKVKDEVKDKVKDEVKDEVNVKDKDGVKDEVKDGVKNEVKDAKNLLLQQHVLPDVPRLNAADLQLILPLLLFQLLCTLLLNIFQLPGSLFVICVQHLLTTNSNRFDLLLAS